MTLHLTTGPLKTRFGVVLVPRYELDTCRGMVDDRNWLIIYFGFFNFMPTLEEHKRRAIRVT